jgi:succinyl-CoA synthetase beta subunit
MEGTNVEEGRRILSESGLNLINATDLADAASKVAELVA